MDWLLADVGGTNTRMAVAGPSGIKTIARFVNDDHAGFDEVLARFAGDRQFTQACIAVAGPVGRNTARLTNRDWSFDAGAISARLGGAAVHLVNDLGALGAAVPALPGEALEPLTDDHPTRDHQAVVFGMGTGANLCGIRTTPSGASLLWEAELGHAALPAPIAQMVPASITTVEELFAGRGLARLGGHETAHEVVDCATPRCRRAVETVASAAGLFCRELTFQYLPRGGIFLSGSVARGVIGGAGRAHFLSSYTTPTRDGIDLGDIPVALITDDAAALTGCMEILRARQ